MLVSAYAVLDVYPKQQEISIGSVGTYNLMLNTSDSGEGKLIWISADKNITARIGDSRFKNLGSYNFTNTPNIAQNFTFEVKVTGGVVGSEKEIRIFYKNTSFKGWLGIKAIATASVTQIPELTTIVLVGMGMLGLIGLKRWYDEKYENYK